MSVDSVKRDRYPSESAVSRHFRWGEWVCKCGKCEEQKIDLALFDKMEELRHRLGDRPMYITSGYRCEAHNKAVGGAKKSKHLLGIAADIRVHGRRPVDVGKAAVAVGFTGVKVYESWVHIDIREGKPWIVLGENA